MPRFMLSDSSDLTELALGVPGDRYLQEFAPLGTGGGLYHFRDQILAGDPEAFFVLNADVCSDFPLSAMLAAHRHQPHPFLLLGTTVRGAGGCRAGDPERFLGCRVLGRQGQNRELEWECRSGGVGAGNPSSDGGGGGERP